MSLKTSIASARTFTTGIFEIVRPPSIQHARRKVQSAVAELARVEKLEAVRQGRIERLRAVKYKHVENVYASIDRDHDRISNSARVSVNANDLARTLRSAA